jgi:hypothetical protein
MPASPCLTGRVHLHHTAWSSLARSESVALLSCLALPAPHCRTRRPLIFHADACAVRLCSSPSNDLTLSRLARPSSHCLPYRAMHFLPRQASPYLAPLRPLSLHRPDNLPLTASPSASFLVQPCPSCLPLPASLALPYACLPFPALSASPCLPRSACLALPSWPCLLGSPCLPRPE